GTKIEYPSERLRGKKTLLDGDSVIGEISITSCGHTVCKDCLSTWQSVSHGAYCPDCTKELTGKEVYTFQPKAVAGRQKKNISAEATPSSSIDSEEKASSSSSTTRAAH